MKERSQHILLLSSWYPSAANPFLGNFVQRQAELLSTHFNVSVLYITSSNINVQSTSKNEVNSSFTEYIVELPSSKTIFGRQLKQRKIIREYSKIIAPVDVIVSHVLLPKAPLFTFAKKVFNCPWIHFEHGSYFREDKLKEWSFAQKSIVKRAVKKIDSIVAVSDVLKKDMRRIIQKEIDVIPNHVNTEIFNYRKKVKSEILRFLHISTLDETIKNPYEIIDACRLFKDQYDIPFHLTIVSDESYSRLQKYTIKHELSDIITFVGPKKWEELSSFYHNADAFILNSNYESFSIVLAEAWATGTPVISPSVGIGSELSPEFGIQTTGTTSKALSEGMHRFNEQKDLFDTEKIVSHSQQYSSVSVLNKLNALIENCVK